jgi:hypothetical protein
MAFRRIALIYGLLATAAGILLMGWGPMLLGYLGSSVGNDLGSFSLIRLAGVGLLMAGMLLLAVRPVQDISIQRRIYVAMVVSHVLGGLILWSQQTAIWNSPLGAVLAAWPWLTAATFAFFVFRMRKSSGLQQATL